MDDRDFQLAATSILASESWKQEGFKLCYKPFFYREDGSEGLQNVHTPFSLCREIIQKLAEFTDMKHLSVCVMYNLEFVDILVKEYGVSPENITFFPDSKQEASAARIVYGVRVADPVLLDSKNKPVMPKSEKKFDVVVMNPPYQPSVKNKDDAGGSSSRGLSIWPKFVQLAIDATKDNGYIAAIHPTKWRKPEDEMFPIMAAQNMLHLEMHSKQDGIKTFGASTPYDWYIMQKKQYEGKTAIKGSDSKREIINLHDFSFLPNCNLEMVGKLLAKPGEEKCVVLYSYSFYEVRKPWMNESKTKEFPYPCVHATGKNGVRYWHSSKKGEFFDLPKIVFGYSDTISNAVVDAQGEYGITPQAMGIPISSQSEGEKIKKALESKAFNDLLQVSLRWSQFQIEWRMFRHFRKDFWRDFI